MLVPKLGLGVACASPLVGLAISCGCRYLEKRDPRPYHVQDGWNNTLMGFSAFVCLASGGLSMVCGSAITQQCVARFMALQWNDIFPVIGK
jgi:hypothetical protein